VPCTSQYFLVLVIARPFLRSRLSINDYKRLRLKGSGHARLRLYAPINIIPHYPPPEQRWRFEFLKSNSPPVGHEEFKSPPENWSRLFCSRSLASKAPLVGDFSSQISNRIKSPRYAREGAREGGSGNIDRCITSKLSCKYKAYTCIWIKQLTSSVIYL